MAKKRENISPETLKQKKELEEFERKLEEHRPGIFDPANPTEKERAAYIDWLGYRLRAWEVFANKQLSPQELEVKCKRSPEVEKELDEIHNQIRQSMEQLKQLEGKENTQEFFSVVTKICQLFDQLYDVMEKRGSPGDKQKAKVYKESRRKVSNDLAQ